MREAKAMVFAGSGGPEVISLQRRSIRDPGPGELLVEVRAAGLNRADILQRQGHYPAPPGSPADIPGLEYAGVVQAIGEGASLFHPGDRVMGIVGGGAMAQYVLVHEREAIPIPERLGFEEAAAIPEVFLTAWDALFRQAGLRLGEKVLIHAVSSGVGTAALQLALLSGARPIGTSRSETKLSRSETLGLQDGIVSENGRFAEALRERTGDGADVILDTVGAAYLAENVRALAPRGRIVTIGLLGGAKGELPLGLLLAKRARLVGTVLRNRPLEEKAELAQAFAHEVLPHFTSGKLRPVVDEVMAMELLAQAHGRMERNELFGKLVLTW